MSGPGDNVTQVTQMPIPPMHYVKLYTDEAVKRGTAPKYAAEDRIVKFTISDPITLQTSASDSRHLQHVWSPRQ